jgi:cytochrome P450
VAALPALERRHRNFQQPAIPGGAQWAATAPDMALVAAEMKDSLREWIGERREAPKEDLLTALIQAEVDGKHLSEEDLLGLVRLLLIGGTENCCQP